MNVDTLLKLIAERPEFIAYLDEAKCAFLAQDGRASFWIPGEPNGEIRSGARYIALLVQIGDDEKPVPHLHFAPGGKHSNDCAVFCKDEKFQIFANNRRKNDRHYIGADGLERMAADYVRETCGIPSRRYLDNSDEAFAIWKEIMSEYSRWTEDKQQGGGV